MLIDFEGATISTTFSELFSVVKKVGQTIKTFDPQLKIMESTLSKIDPIIMERDNCNEWLGYSPNETDWIKDLFIKAKDCLRSAIHQLNFCKKYRHLNKLTKFDIKVLREFQIYGPLLNMRMNGEILWEVKEMRTKCRDS